CGDGGLARTSPTWRAVARQSKQRRATTARRRVVGRGLRVVVLGCVRIHQATWCPEFKQTGTTQSGERHGTASLVKRTVTALRCWRLDRRGLAHGCPRLRPYPPGPTWCPARPSPRERTVTAMR
ncbi:MAG TPA: hypothetical protein VK601_11390, partial [Kofleriaceae bacterium]|nr:hypothetical protein [Kofleriaceae bacterium]